MGRGFEGFKTFLDMERGLSKVLMTPYYYYFSPIMIDAFNLIRPLKEEGFIILTDICRYQYSVSRKLIFTK